jgi:hypothetical protein
MPVCSSVPVIHGPAVNDPGTIKLAYIVTAHKDPEQLVRLIERLNSAGTQFFVHVDRRTDETTYRQMVKAIGHLPNVRFLKRYKCYRSSAFGIVQALFEGFDAAFTCGAAFDYLLYITSQDYPIKTNSQIRAVLQNAAGYSFLSHLPFPYEGWHASGGPITQKACRIESWHIRLFGRYFQFPLNPSHYSHPFSLSRSPLWLTVNLLFPRKRKFPRGFTPVGGWAYWCLAREHAEYVCRFAKLNPSFVNFFRYSRSSVEMIVQTILMASPFKHQIINDDLRYVDWSTGNCSPKILGVADLPKLAASLKLIARKFDMLVDAEVLDRIDEQILNRQESCEFVSVSPRGVI